MMSCDLKPVVIGVDVGGTNTDAVILELQSGSDSRLHDSPQTPKIIGSAKTATTHDVTTGVKAAIHLALINTKKNNRNLSVKQVNIGTTHFINAVVEGKGLKKVSVIRLCGTSSRKVLPFVDMPDALVGLVKSSVFMVNGGYQFDGSEISQVQEKEIRECLETFKKNGEKNIVVSGIFSPIRKEQEDKVANIVKSFYPEASVTLTHEIGKLGLLQRENAAILNESIKPLCRETIQGFHSAIDKLGLKCPMYLTQNDGTIISEEKATKYPVLTFASGATNSMRGAAFLSGVKDAIVVDIGGTSTDVGLLLEGFPREASSEVKVGGVSTNFRMPDVRSIGLGGGSYVIESQVNEQSRVKVGPRSAGYQIESEALVFADLGQDLSSRKLTATDIAAAAGLTEVGNKSNISHLERNFVEKATEEIFSMITDCLDQMRFSDRDLPLILVGGGSVIVDKNWKFSGVSNIMYPEHFDVANAVGAALSQISSSLDTIVDYNKYLDGELSEEQNTRKEQMTKAREAALADAMIKVREELCKSDVVEESISLIEKEDVTLSYIPGNATRIKLKMVGDLKAVEASDTGVVPDFVYTTTPELGKQTHKQRVSTSGYVLTDITCATTVTRTPKLDPSTGEWELSEYDIECICIGAGILGCGGGGNTHVARLLALNAVKDGKKITIVNPERFMDKADPKNDVVVLVAFMGAPLVMYEKLVSGCETPEALHCLQDLFKIGKYNNGHLENAEGVDIREKEGITYINDYQVKDPSSDRAHVSEKKIVALMSAEIGGMNCIEPLIVAADLGLPVLDCDGMGRAFPELQMFAPFIYGCKPYPATLADDKGQRAAVLYTDTPKTLENHFRDTVIGMGCSGGVTFSYFNKDDILGKTVQHSLSRAWQIGDAVLQARADNKPPVKTVIAKEHGKLVINGKISDIKRETTGGFNKGRVIIEGVDDFTGMTAEIEFQNEFLMVRDRDSKEVLVCVPDLVTMMDMDTAQPIMTEEVRFGIRVSVVGMRCPPLMSSEQALQVVGPAAFGYKDVDYKPVGEYIDCEPIPPK